MASWDAQAKRITAILDAKAVPDVNEERLETYRAYLQAHLTLPCPLTGIEDFEWEEYYVIGPGSKKEYEQLRKTRPSYQDTFECLGFEEAVDADYGIMVRVRRVSDKKKFVLPLAELEAIERQSKNYQLLDAYSVWFVNYRS